MNKSDGLLETMRVVANATPPTTLIATTRRAERLAAFVLQCCDEIEALRAAAATTPAEDCEICSIVHDVLWHESRRGTGVELAQATIASLATAEAARAEAEQEAARLRAACDALVVINSGLEAACGRKDEAMLNILAHDWQPTAKAKTAVCEEVGKR